MARKITAGDVQRKINECRESDEPDAILEILRAHEGKPLTKRILPKLPSGEARWRIRQVAGMTHLEDRDYLNSSGGRGISLLISYAIANVRIDCSEIVKRNGAYFEARIARNKLRMEAANSAMACQRMADVLNDVRRARAALAEAEGKLNELTAYGAPFSPDRSTWEGASFPFGKEEE